MSDGVLLAVLRFFPLVDVLHILRPYRSFRLIAVVIAIVCAPLGSPLLASSTDRPEADVYNIPTETLVAYGNIEGQEVTTSASLKNTEGPAPWWNHSDSITTTPTISGYIQSTRVNNTSRVTTTDVQRDRERSYFSVTGDKERPDVTGNLKSTETVSIASFLETTSAMERSSVTAGTQNSNVTEIPVSRDDAHLVSNGNFPSTTVLPAIVSLFDMSNTPRATVTKSTAVTETMESEGTSSLISIPYVTPNTDRSANLGDLGQNHTTDVIITEDAAIRDYRYLDLSLTRGVNLSLFCFNLDALEFLNMSHCELTNVSLFAMLVLETLDVSHNHLTNVSLPVMPLLETLDLSHNRLTGVTALNLGALPRLLYLDLSHNPLAPKLDTQFTSFINQAQLSSLDTLLMNDVGLGTIIDDIFKPLTQLKYLELTQNSLRTYGKGALSGLTALESLSTDEPALCCGYYHDGLDITACLAPEDDISSCRYLLAKDAFRVALWIMAALALLGNLGVLVARQVLPHPYSAFHLLVGNLCASDLLMGVYLTVIGSADAELWGEYAAEERTWKASFVCRGAGFLAFLSSEVSAFIICLVTLDRVLVFCVPFKKHLHLTPQAAAIACCVCWAVGAVLASAPLLAGLDFYGQNALCVPLPVARRAYQGQQYSFYVFTFLNLVLFVLIGVGQIAIYVGVRRTRAAVGVQRYAGQHEMKVVRRLFLVVLTDFLCWFPVGLLGMLAAYGDIEVPTVVNVWAAILVLPVNSAINPYIYTLYSAWERRRAVYTVNKRWSANSDQKGKVIVLGQKKIASVSSKVDMNECKTSAERAI